MSERQSPTFDATPHVDPKRISALMGQPVTPEPEPESQAEQQRQSVWESQPERQSQPEWQSQPDRQAQSKPEPQPKREPTPKPKPEPQPVPEPAPEPQLEPESEVETPRMPSVTFRPIPAGGWPFKPLANRPRGNFCCVAKECKC